MQVLKKSLSNKHSINLKIPNDPSFISLARLVLAAQLRENSVDEEEIDDMKLVLGEFLAKTIEANLASKCFSISFSFSEGIAEILIENLEEFKPNEIFNSSYLNFETIKSLVDHFDLILNEKQSIAVKITKRFNG